MTSVPERAEAFLAELARRTDPGPDPELEALRLAILLEDGLDIVLDDEDIRRLRSGGPSSVEELLARKPGRH